MTLGERVHDEFARAFGGAPDGVARAPGRVNLIGEHTDYNDGFVLPIAIAAETRVAFRRRCDGEVRVVACDLDNALDTFDAHVPFASGATGGWQDYVRGTVAALREAGAMVGGAELAIAGDVPRGSGLSSSASLEVAVGLALATAAGAPADPLMLAQAGQRAENAFVGVRCGIMDQLASAASIAGAASLIDCRALTCTPVPLPPDVAVGIVQSGVARGLVEGHYNRRRAECEEAAAALGLTSLRDAGPAMLEANRLQMSDAAFRRARHVLTENSRVRAAAAALEAGDLAALGGHMAASHASMRDDFAITTPDVDRLVEVADASIAAHAGGRGGARMTGGGFGGAVVIVAPAAAMAAIAATLAAEFQRPDGRPCTTMVTQAAAGASLMDEAGH